MGGFQLGAQVIESRGRGPRPSGQVSHLPFDRLLPLPPKHVDQSFNVTTREEDQNRYLNRLFHPLRHEHLFPDFPRFLREAADFVERRSKGAPATPHPPASGPGTPTRGGVRGPRT